MIRQVRMLDNFADSTGNMSEKRIFAFGTHPKAVTAEGLPDPDQQHHANAASAQMNSLRIILDEILVGNNLEEMECRFPIDDSGNVFDRVPLGATPQDIADCATPRDVLPATCVNEHRVCLCQKEMGCVVGTQPDPNDPTGMNQVPLVREKGEPVGVLDMDEDGAADNTRMIAGAVGIDCNGTSILIDQENSYFTPSGDQNVPAMGGFDVLGPAIVLTPATALRTNTDCHLTFAESVTDKENNQICAPANGDIEQDCTPGDVSAFTFKVQALTLTSQTPDGSTMVPRTDVIGVDTNVPMMHGTEANITMTEDNVAFTNFTASLGNMDRQFVVAPNGGMWGSMKTYKVTFPTTITDAGGGTLPAPVTITFTTAP